MTLSRRELLKRAGYFVGYFSFTAASQAFRPLLAQPAIEFGTAPDRFPQGVASADPQPDAVLLWTRATPPQQIGERVIPIEHAYGPDQAIVLQVSESREFEQLILEEELVATVESDYTVRTLVRGLQPDTTYFYRFLIDGDTSSRIGRTWTAPAETSKRPVHVMLASCQGYPVNEWGSYRRFLLEQTLPGEPRADFVLHVGDYVYSYSGPEPEIPVGTGQDPFEQALANKRRTYRGYHRDAELQDARAMFPFICIWDDHEYTNDAWQSVGGGRRGGPNQVGRLAATRAWFEYVPQILDESLTMEGVENHAHNYRQPDGIKRTATLGQFDEEFLSLDPDNLAAIYCMTSYRTIHWGGMADLIIPDERSYRGPSANPSYTVVGLEQGVPGDSAFSGMKLYEGDLLFTLAEGKRANGGNPPETVTLFGKQVANPRRDDPPVSMLGSTQKDWFKRSLSASKATWKVIVNSVPMKGFYFNTGEISEEVGSGFKWTDSWDGFPNERKELMEYIIDNQINNVVSLTGDRHAHYAGMVASDYTADDLQYGAVEFTCASISAFLRSGDIAGSLEAFGVGHLGEYQRILPDGTPETVANCNVLMRMGAKAAQVMYETDDLEAARAAADPGVNPHLVYADNDAHGYTMVHFYQDRVEADFVTVPRTEWNPEVHPDGPPLRRKVGFRTMAWLPGEQPSMQRIYESGETNFGDG